MTPMADQHIRVLLVEDDRVFADLLTKQFSTRGTEIVHCGTGKEALHVLERDGAFDVMLLDISLPDIDGLEILSRIAGIPTLAKIPVIIISNFAVEKDIEWVQKMGVKQVIKKISVMPGEIVDAALRVCQEGRQGHS